MTYTGMAGLMRAMEIAAEAHAGMTYGDAPYVIHPIRVARRVLEEGVPHWVVAAAVLHDVVEDTPVGLNHLRAFGISEPVVRLVDALTRRPGETYDEFLSRVIEAGAYARLVKIADVTENLSNNPPESKRERYERALKRLTDEPWRTH